MTYTAVSDAKRYKLPGLAFLVPAAMIALLILLLYSRVAAKLVLDWYELPDFSHGFLIPFFTAFLLWERRDRIAQAPFRPRQSGIALIAVALFVLLIGRFGADLFFMRISFLMLTAGVVLSLFGSAMLRIVALPILVLLLAIPLPTVLFNQLTFPLQMFASSLASSMLPLAGVPVLREGNVITLASMQLEVAEACSGIRSMMSLFAVAVLFGYFFEKSNVRRVLLALASLPIAVLANAVRIFGTGICVQYWNPDKAVGFFHEFSGWLMFLVSLVALYLTHIATRTFAPGRSAQAT
jgi:exosortase